MGKIIELESKYGPLRGHLSGKGPAILILPSWWGLNRFFLSFCEQVASEGFLTLGLDYYNAKVAASLAQAELLHAVMQRSKMEKQVLEAFDWLAKDEVKAAAIGFSLGARFAYGLLLARPNTLTALVAFYGVGGGLYKNAATEVMAHYAEDDQYGAHSLAAKKMKTRLEDSLISIQSFTYPGTKHWFFEEDRPEYNKEAAKNAWERTRKFLKTHA